MTTKEVAGSDRVAERAVMPLAVGAVSAARVLGISRTQVWRLISSGEIPTFRVGSRRLISMAALQKFIDERASVGAA